MKTKKVRVSGSNIGKVDSTLIARHLMVNNKLAKKRNVELENLFGEMREVNEALANKLWKPFKKLVDGLRFKDTRNTMNILTGVMGQGKTHTMINKMVRHLLFNESHGLDAIIVGVPMTEVADINDWDNSDLSDDGVKIYDLHDDDNRMLADLDRGKKVVKLITDQAFTGDRGMRLIQALNKRDKKFAVFIDESHTWLISHYTKLQLVSGNTKTPTYKGTLFSRCAEIATYNPYVFGLTATPNREQTNDISTSRANGVLNFNLVNKLPSLSEIMFRQSWLDDKGEDNYFDPTDENEVLSKLANRLHEFYKTESFLRSFGMSRSIMYQVNVDSTHGINTRADVQKLIQQIIDVNDLEAYDASTIGVLGVHVGYYSNSERTRTNQESRWTGSTEEEILKRIKDPTDSLKHLIVVDKGKMGLNIPNLSMLVSFRMSEKDPKDTVEKITYNNKQLLGRLVRMYVSPTNAELNTKDPDGGDSMYGLMHYVARASNEDITVLYDSNSFGILVARSETWVQAVDEFKECYANTLDEAIAEIVRFRGKYSILNFSMAPLNLRNTNGGEVSNENGVDFEFESVVALLELVHSFNSVFSANYYVYYQKANVISSSVNSHLVKYLRKYPTDTSFLRGKYKKGSKGFLIDVDAFVAKDNPVDTMAFGVSCKCSLKDAGGDAILAGLERMKEYLNIPAIGMYRLYNKQGVSSTQYKSCPFYNVIESNFYDKVVEESQRLNTEFNLFGLNNDPSLDIPLHQYSDVAKLFSSEGYDFVWNILVKHDIT